MPGEKPLIRSRKADHIRINLEEDVQSGITTGLESYRFNHNALPEINLNDIDTGQVIYGKNMAVPLLISSMTGGTEKAELINRHLAEAAQQAGIAMGLGSQRSAIEDTGLSRTFQVRQYAPDILLLANIGAVQLNYGYDTNQVRRLIEMVEADALVLHLNALQEALQPEGDTNFLGLLKKIEDLCHQIEIPVIVKEVGWGISGDTAKRLINSGVSAIDVAGAGGTSWSQVEMHRMRDENLAKVAETFRNWGIPTADSIIQVRMSVPGTMIIASGGLRDGVDIAKCIALGAQIGGMARPFLIAANQSTQTVINLIEHVAAEIRICMFLSGAMTISSLQHTQLSKIGN
jgi:isopentenyl-diphosphate Delta-isomerase